MDYIENPDTLEEFRLDNSLIRSFKVRMAKQDIVLEEKDRNRGWKRLTDPFGLKTFYFTDEDEGFYEIVVRRGRQKSSMIDKGKVIEAVEHLKEGDKVVSVTAETQDACYDLIDGNYFNYLVNIEVMEKKVDRETFFSEIERLYQKYAKHILSTLRNNS